MRIKYASPASAITRKFRFSSRIAAQIRCRFPGHCAAACPVALADLKNVIDSVFYELPGGIAIV
jgi:hypothetical protein